MVGAEAGAGAGAPDGVDHATTAVAADVADADPFRLLAVTTSRSVLPASAAASEYADPPAPAIAEQPAPLESQRSHW
ncbi:MAG: hypothetical protein ACRDLR_00640 [Gaiellaceae bacterium]